MALGITSQQASGGGQRAMVADAGEYVQHFALFGSGVRDAIGREQRQSQAARDFDGRLVA